MKNNEAYDILIEVQKSVTRLEDKMDKRLCMAETKIDTLESFRDNLLGKIGVVIVIVDFIAIFMIDWLREKLHI